MKIVEFAKRWSNFDSEHFFFFKDVTTVKKLTYYDIKKILKTLMFC